MSNSALSVKRAISPYRNSPRNHKIDTITIHCTAGRMSADGLCGLFQRSESSCNYAIADDGTIVTIVDEADRSWCSSSPENDNRAITIECSSDSYEPYKINGRVWDSLIRLCADICQRNGIPVLKWQGDKSLIGQTDKQNMTVHRWFANKSCPGEYLYSRMGAIAAQVNEILKGEDDEMLSYEDFVKYMDRYNQEQAKKPAAKWAENGIQRAKEYGIMAGDAKGDFHPQSSLTRQEAAILAAGIMDKVSEMMEGRS